MSSGPDPPLDNKPESENGGGAPTGNGIAPGSPPSYQNDAPNSTGEQQHSLSTAHRGFSTSIVDMFESTENERIDCCSLACCGILQADRDRYLVSGISPPGMFRRVMVHVITPFTIFITAGYCAIYIPRGSLNQLFSTLFVLALLGYWIQQLFKGRAKRMEVRKDLLWLKHHQDGTQQRRRDDEEDRIEDYGMGQTAADVGCAHALCGCYLEDRFSGNGEDPSATTTMDNLCKWLFQKLVLCTCCGRHFQLCGMCAVAQEAREIEQLLPPQYRRVDYVSMQPMLDYYSKIYQQRFLKKTWPTALSSLTKFLTRSLLALLVVLAIWWMLINVDGMGTVHFSILLCTFLQAFILVAIVNYKGELSLDALCKFFACGFLLSTTSAVFLEVAAGMVLRIILSCFMAILGVDVVADDDGYEMRLPRVGFAEQSSSSDRDNYLQVFGNDHPIIYTLYLLTNAFLMAALIEEICKYFGYQMVEHPDFFSQEELEEIASQQQRRSTTNGETTVTTTDFSRQTKSRVNLGCAITVAMVTVALGFACCENLVYIFVYNGASVGTELYVLIFRSLFPIHPVAAAMQSLCVCERDVENKRLKFLDIVKVALLFHGGYDFMLMWIDFLATRKGVFLEDGEYPPIAGIISLVFSFLILISGLVYFFWASNKQRARLEAMDREVVVDQSRLI